MGSLRPVLRLPPQPGIAAGITAGCATVPLRYCPNQSVTRAQMATFLHRALLGQQAQPAEATVISNDLLSVLEPHRERLGVRGAQFRFGIFE